MSLVDQPHRWPRDAAATKARILEAAVEEFSEHGLAGARVDRIADKAGANKRLIYVYFGSKDELFDATLKARVSELADAVPFTPEDLGAYVGALFDQLVANPDVVRLTIWRNLERDRTTEQETAVYATKLAQVRAAQHAGAIDSELPAADVMAIVMALAMSWVTAPPPLKALSRGDPASRGRLRAHRAALVRVVTRALSP